MPTDGVIEIDGETYCVDLEKMLKDPNCPRKYLVFVRKWLDEVQKRRRLDEVKKRRKEETDA